MPIRKHTIPAAEITRISHGQNNHDHPRSNFSNHFQSLKYQQNFLNQAPHFSFQNPPAEKKVTDLEDGMETLIKS